MDATATNIRVGAQFPSPLPRVTSASVATIVVGLVVDLNCSVTPESETNALRTACLWNAVNLETETVAATDNRFFKNHSLFATNFYFIFTHLEPKCYTFLISSTNLNKICKWTFCIIE